MGRGRQVNGLLIGAAVLTLGVGALVGVGLAGAVLALRGAADESMWDWDDMEDFT
jgi:hypothetical protein